MFHKIYIFFIVCAKSAAKQYPNWCICLKDLPLIYCLTCMFLALEDIASKESEVDAEVKEPGLGEKADFTTVGLTFLFNMSLI